MAQYEAAKAAHPDAIVLFRLGDFFEIFGEDARRAAGICGLTLTSRDFGRAGRRPMCGVPHHSVEVHLKRLLENGCTVAICDQVEPAAAARGVVRRAVTRILTPGTVVDGALIASDRAQRCVALVADGGVVGVAALDVSTGDCQLLEVEGGLGGSALAEELERLDVVEVLVADGLHLGQGLVPSARRTHRPAGEMDPATARTRLAGVVGRGRLAAAGVADWAAAQAAAGALLSYCTAAHLQVPGGFLRLRARSADQTMRLDAATRRNLELVEASTPSGQSLLQLLDDTRTPPGGRRLRAWVQEPLRALDAILDRQGAVMELLEERAVRAGLREGLGPCRDLDRLVGRCVQGLASPRDLSALHGTLAALPAVAAAAGSLTSPLTRRTVKALGSADGQLVEVLAAALVDDPPTSAREGGVIRDGFDPELDAVRAGSRDARAFISGLEASERARTGIRSLKVGFNRVFGYYLEVPNAHRDRLPPDYVRKQTLVGAERYITADLKEQETIVLTARDRGVARELQCLQTLQATVAGAAGGLMTAADGLATLDALQSLAATADRLGWVRPEMDGSRRLEIRQGRHPLVEAALGPGRFVPNDVDLNGGQQRIVVLTGPNMAGKSTFLRQVAIITLLAHLGAAVPAAAARIGLVDRIFTRVGAHDELAAGRSTFMVEMAEMATILATATPASLLVLDEIGRGTSTYDGLSIAQAIVEYLHENPAVAARTCFATHYHEL
ncbi:MAG TPA: DNA mismatch repair protein MutS, partial [Candidatus Dormibacteraeota bacterium]|nr:DNA mismatch repair protein MutS [Candidatus Dormibacteraeota bacterium]